jgi:hypothetical protein
MDLKLSMTAPLGYVLHFRVKFLELFGHQVDALRIPPVRRLIIAGP